MENKTAASVEVEIKLFGIFKKYSDGGTLTLSVSADSKVTDVKATLGAKLYSISASSETAQRITGLVERSVLADEKRILKEGDLLGTRRSLAILPPVCGG